MFFWIVRCPDPGRALADRFALVRMRIAHSFGFNGSSLCTEDITEDIELDRQRCNEVFHMERTRANALVNRSICARTIEHLSWITAFGNGLK